MKADVELDVLAPYAVTVEGLKNRQSLTLGSGRTLFIGQGEKHRVSAAECTSSKHFGQNGRISKRRFSVIPLQSSSFRSGVEPAFVL